MSIFEALMLIAFGSAWPMSIIKSYRSRTAKGKSLHFMIIIGLGYVAGITHKLLYSRDIVIIFYFLNILMVITDIILYFRNRIIDRNAG